MYGTSPDTIGRLPLSTQYHTRIESSMITITEIMKNPATTALMRPGAS